MKATLNVNVTELSHEELVALFSTSFYGNDYMDATYDHDFYHEFRKEHPVNEAQCWEDILADMVINSSILVIDNEAVGEVYGTLPHQDEEDMPDLLSDGQIAYKVTYQDILKGCSTEEGYKLIQDVISGEGDFYTAWNLMQIIVFGEIIYG